MDRSKRIILCTSAALVLTGCASAGPGVALDPDAPDAPPSAAGAEVDPGGADAAFFSEAQVERGERVFADICSECHYASEMSDASFRFAWRRQTVGDLFDLVAETMPESRPGSLTPDQYADVVAYILSLNGFAAGDRDMPADAAALEVHSLAALSS